MGLVAEAGSGRIKARLLILLLFICWPALTHAAQTGAATQPVARVPLPRTGQISCYDDKGAVIDYKGCGQDCEQQRGVVWPVPRFMINKDGTVTDKLTGFRWLGNGKCFKGLTWLGAKEKIAALNEKRPGICKGYQGDYQDWIMPDVRQLASLLDAEEAGPADYLRSQGLGHVQAGVYWTASSYQNPLDAWTVDFSNGAVIFKDKLDKLFLLPMRKPDNGAQVGTRPVAPGREAAEGLKNSPARFTDNGDGTVTDNQTGLMWLREPDCLSNLAWSAGLATVRSFNTVSDSVKCQGYGGTYHDWVLPNRVELMSLIDYDRDYPAVLPGIFAVTSEGRYWTSTTAASAPDHAYTVNFDNGRQYFAEKDKLLKVLPVRRIASSPLPSRLESVKAGAWNIKAGYILALAPELHTDIVWPPAPRFLANGDGTSMDRLTGITWLGDGNCFGRKSWQGALDAITEFNKDPRKFKCEGYEASFNDWQLPVITDLQRLINPDKKDSAAWMNSQGVVNVQSGGDYWSRSETFINLYYAKVVRFKGGSAVRAFPKSLKFFLWPRRALPNTPGRKPLLNLTVNAIGDALELSPDCSLSLVVFLHTFGLEFPADFWLWYDTPDGKQLWLSNIRSWNDKMTPVHQGPLFNLKNYEIFRSPAKNSLAPGRYIFHFAVDATPDGVLDKTRYESQVTVTIKPPKNRN